MHTFGAKLAFDPHIHMLVTEGGLKNGFGWSSCSYFPHQALKSRFRTLLIKKLRNAAKEKILSVPLELKNIWRNKFNFFGNFFSLTQKLYSVIWYVHIGEKLDNAYYTVRYIGRYAKRPSISETRILYYNFEKQIVKFQYHDKHTNTKKIAISSVEEFISRLIRHIPEKNFRMIRYCGLYANCVKNEYISLLSYQIIELFGIANLQFDNNIASQPKNWRERIIKSTGKDPLSCAKCGSPMEPVKIVCRIRDGTFKTFFINSSFC
jgi:hypothetical protein